MHLLSIIIPKKFKKKGFEKKLKIYFYAKSKFIQKYLKVKNFEEYIIIIR
jgi:hypothetical protein